MKLLCDGWMITHTHSHTPGHEPGVSHTHCYINTHDSTQVSSRWLCVCVCVADLGLSLLQQRLQPLLSGSAFVVIADDQDDVVPPELSHQVEPDVGLVGVRRHRPQERQVDALRRRGRRTV